MINMWMFDRDIKKASSWLTAMEVGSNWLPHGKMLPTSTRVTVFTENSEQFRTIGKTGAKQPLKKDKSEILMTNGSLMKVESILQYFWPALSNNWYWKTIFGYFENGHFTQVLLYM